MGGGGGGGLVFTIHKKILKHYVYSVSNFRPLGLYQETNN